MGQILAISLVVGSLALLWVLVELRGEPARGRTRCRRCWYPMPHATPATCPECGRVATLPSHLLRTRRRPLRTAVALALLLLCQAGWLEPTVQRSGWVGIVPTPVLVRLLTVVPNDWIVPPRAPRPGTILVVPSAPQYADDRTLSGRMRATQLSPEQFALVRRGLLARMQDETDPRLLERWYALIAASDASNRRPPPRGPDQGWPEARPPSPEVEEAAARLVEVTVQELATSPDRACEWLWFWIRGQIPGLIFDPSLGGLASEPVIRVLRSNQAALRSLLSSNHPRAQATAAALLVYAGLATLDDVPTMTALAGGSDAEAGSAALAALWCLGVEHDEAFGAWRQLLQIPDPNLVPARERDQLRWRATAPLRPRLFQSESVARTLAYGRIRTTPGLVRTLLDGQAMLIDTEELCEDLIQIPHAQPDLIDRAVRELVADGGAFSARWQFLLARLPREAIARNANRLLPMLDPAAGSWINRMAIDRLQPLVTCPSEHRDAVVASLQELRDWYDRHREVRHYDVTIGAINQLLDALRSGIGDGQSNPGIDTEPSLPRGTGGMNSSSR